jgi:hypothetical protein
MEKCKVWTVMSKEELPKGQILIGIDGFLLKRGMNYIEQG